jgi:hypothetical protein
LRPSNVIVLRKMTLNTSRKLFHGSVKDIHASNKATKKKKKIHFMSSTHTTRETGQYGFTNIRNMVKRGAVEICITLGRMTDSPFSPVNRFPPNDHRLYTRPHVKYPGKVDLLYSIR